MNCRSKCLSILLAAVSVILSLPAAGREARNIFSTAFDAMENKSDFFKPGGEWMPYPAYEDRSGWDDFTKGYKKSIVVRGVKAMGYTWDTGLGKGVSTKNRAMLTTLVFAELAEGQGRFIPKIAELTRSFCGQISFSLNNDRFPNGGTPLELGTSSAAMVLAFPYFYFRKYWDAVDPGLSELVQKRLHEEIFDPFMDPSREQNWMGFKELKGDAYLNNWNPFCNFQIAIAFLLAEPDPEKVLAGVERSIRSIDRYVDYVALDGSCEEGPSYWNMAGAKVYEFARLMYDVTGGRINVFDDNQIRLMGEWRSYVEIGDGIVANFSDSGPRGTDSCADIMFRAGVDCHSQVMVDFALYKFINDAGDGFRRPAILSPGEGNRLYRALEALRYMPELEKTKQQAIDGSGLLYFGRIPVLVDLGTNHDSYGYNFQKLGFKTKYGVWSVNSDWHNCPAPNGFGQSPGREHCAGDASCPDGSFSLDVSAAYPSAARCTKWLRTWTLSDMKLVIRDEYELTERVAPDLEYFIVRGDVFLPGDDLGGRKAKKGEVILHCVSFDSKRDIHVRIRYPKSMTPSVERKDVSGNRDLKNNWGDEVKRIVFKSDGSCPVSGEYVFEISRIN